MVISNRRYNRKTKRKKRSNVRSKRTKRSKRSKRSNLRGGAESDSGGLMDLGWMDEDLSGLVGEEEDLLSGPGWDGGNMVTDDPFNYLSGTAQPPDNEAEMDDLFTGLSGPSLHGEELGSLESFEPLNPLEPVEESSDSSTGQGQIAANPLPNPSAAAATWSRYVPPLDDDATLVLPQAQLAQLAPQPAQPAQPAGVPQPPQDLPHWECNGHETSQVDSAVICYLLQDKHSRLNNFYVRWKKLVEIFKILEESDHLGNRVGLLNKGFLPKTALAWGVTSDSPEKQAKRREGELNQKFNLMNSLTMAEFTQQLENHTDEDGVCNRDSLYFSPLDGPLRKRMRPNEGVAAEPAAEQPECMFQISTPLRMHNDVILKPFARPAKAGLTPWVTMKPDCLPMCRNCTRTVRKHYNQVANAPHVILEGFLDQVHSYKCETCKNVISTSDPDWDPHKFSCSKCGWKTAEGVKRQRQRRAARTEPVPSPRLPNRDGVKRNQPALQLEKVAQVLKDHKYIEVAVSSEASRESTSSAITWPADFWPRITADYNLRVGSEREEKNFRDSVHIQIRKLLRGREKTENNLKDVLESMSAPKRPRTRTRKNSRPAGPAVVAPLPVALGVITQPHGSAPHQDPPIMSLPVPQPPHPPPPAQPHPPPPAQPHPPPPAQPPPPPPPAQPPAQPHPPPPPAQPPAQPHPPPPAQPPPQPAQPPPAQPHPPPNYSGHYDVDPTKPWNIGKDSLEGNPGAIKSAGQRRRRYEARQAAQAQAQI